MTSKLMSVTVRGKQKTWCFNFYGDPKYVEEWRADGLEIDLIENIIPMWIHDYGLTRAWCFVQDVWNFKNPWKGWKNEP